MLLRGIAALAPVGLIVPVVLPAAPVWAAQIAACDTVAGLKSGGGSAASGFRITNASPGKLSVGWIDYDGKPMALGDVGRDGETSFQSYATHAWVLETAAGDCVCAIVLEGGDEHVSIGGDLQCVSGPIVSADYEPTGSYATEEIEGWQVRISSAYTKKQFAPVRKMLVRKLAEIRKLLPPNALQRMQSVPLWLVVEDERFPGAAYHWDAGWLRDNGMNPDMAKGIEITANLVPWTSTQPLMVLHEIAHAFEALVLGGKYPALMAAYRAARDSGKYDSVRYVQGGKQKAYAMNNESEYFAELTEAYFGKNDYYPFNRKELKEFDPEGYAVVEAIWKTLD